MKHPLTERIRTLYALMARAMSDMRLLLELYSEQEAKPYIEMLAPVIDTYQEKVDELSERLRAQGGIDVEIGPDSFGM